MKNSQKTEKNIKKPLKWQKPSEIRQKCRTKQNFEKPSKMVRNGQKCPKRQKCRKLSKKTVKNFEKQLKLLKNNQKFVKKVEKPSQNL